jgi:hypothetical protein
MCRLVVMLRKVLWVVELFAFSVCMNTTSKAQAIDVFEKLNNKQQLLINCNKATSNQYVEKHEVGLSIYLKDQWMDLLPQKGNVPKEKISPCFTEVCGIFKTRGDIIEVVVGNVLVVSEFLVDEHSKIQIEPNRIDDPKLDQFGFSNNNIPVLVLYSKDTEDGMFDQFRDKNISKPWSHQLRISSNNLLLHLTENEKRLSLNHWNCHSYLERFYGLFWPRKPNWSSIVFRDLLAKSDI